jgi:hypothetical protein
MSSNRPRIAVVVAAYDAAGHIEELTERPLCVLSGMRDLTFELLFVVEGHDGTADILRTLAKRCPDIKLIEPAVSQGLGAAFRLGFAANLRRSTLS